MSDFKYEKLTDIFPDTLGYYFEKIGEAVLGNKPREFGAIHVKLVSDIIQQFQDVLNEWVDLEPRDGLTYTLEEIEYPLNQLQEYFDNPNASKLNDKDARVFLFFIYEKVKSLRSMAGEVDAEFQP